ncbi:MAG: hypothetical protein ACOYXB_13925 [Bacteroidota bacterium]
MNLVHLLKVLNFLKQIADDGIILKKYRELEALLKSAEETTDRELVNRIYHTREQLRLLLNETNPDGLEYNAYLLLNKIDRFGTLGKIGADYLQETAAEDVNYTQFYRNMKEKADALEQILLMSSDFTQVFEKNLQTELIGEKTDAAQLPVLYLYFENQVKIGRLSDLERYSRIWSGILESFSTLSGLEKLEVELCSMNGEVVEMGILIDHRTMEIIVRGVMSMLNLSGMVVKMRQIAEELTGMHLKNDYRMMLEDEAKYYINQEAEIIASDLITRYSAAEQAGREDVLPALTRSLKQILSFIEKGGRMEYRRLSETLNKDELNRTLNASYRSFELLEEKNGKDNLSGKELKARLISSHLPV